MRELLNLVYRLQKMSWRWLRPRTRGVKVMLFDADGALLLIRNTYGRSDLFVLPGGGIRPFERAEAAASREVREELGLEMDAPTLLTVHRSTSEEKRDTIYLFAARTTGRPQPDRVEVEEAAFFRLEALPATVSPATLRRVDEYRGAAEADGSW
jgi:ADP-ribose pyrophosphatase YjhB (NUDIX family)